MGHDAHHVLQAEWVLHHQFLRMHEKTAPNAPGAEPQYEVIWFLGYDPVSERLVLHLVDVSDSGLRLRRGQPDSARFRVCISHTYVLP